MKKAFEQNVSRSKPRLRMGALLSETPDGAAVNSDEDESAHPAGTTSAKQEEFEPEVQHVVEVTEKVEEYTVAKTIPLAARAQPASPPAAESAPPERAEDEVPEGSAASTPSEDEAVSPDALAEASARREKLKQRLKAVRENPRPEPLPPTVAEAGVRAVERIAQLQTEVTKLKTLNLALTQDLESARRQAERATEEARLRMDEAQRLSSEMEGRAKLLAELESELSSLEGERDESLLALQESRQELEAAQKEKDAMRLEIQRREQALAETLSEEERLASELEEAKDEAAALRRALDALSGERDTLARQVTDLTRERAELMEARKALEAVHRALSKAAAK